MRMQACSRALVCVFLPLAGPALPMRPVCVLGSVRSLPKPESSLSEPGIIACVSVVNDVLRCCV